MIKNRFRGNCKIIFALISLQLIRNMRKVIYLFACIVITWEGMAQQASSKQTSGNPVFPGWYADPEGAIFNKQYWIFPTYSAPYNQQVFMDAFSSKDLVHWTKHEHIVDTAAIKWAKRAMWAPAIV